MTGTGHLVAAVTAGAVAVLALAAPAASAPCPDILPFRSQKVIDSFDPSGLTGLWYEQAFIDIAQVGASCQTLNSTLNATSGVIDMAFAVDYGPLPFTITEVYTPANDTKAYFRKEAQMPGASLLVLPTVVVDFTEGSSLGGGDDGAGYETMTLYSCLNVLGSAVEELVLATRMPTADPAVLSAMEASASKAGVPFNVSQLTMVDHSKCKQ